MIERQFVSQKLKEFQIQEYMAKTLARAGYSHTEIKRTPLGEKVIVYTTRPGMVVGKRGDSIKKMTQYLKTKFKMENPQIEIGEIPNPLLDVHFVADKIAFNMERFGSKRFKSIGYKVLEDIMNAGAIGAEVILSGKIPSARARSWRFSAGYLKKSGDIAQSKIHKYTTSVNLKAGAIGIKVAIMTPDIVLPDKMLKVPDREVVLEEVNQQQVSVKAQEQAGSEEVAPVEGEVQPAGEEPAKKPVKKAGVKKSAKKSPVKKAVKKTSEEEGVEEKK